MSYILEALRKVEQQREHLPAHGLSSKRRYYSAIDSRAGWHLWLITGAVLAGAVLAGVVAYFITATQQAAFAQTPAAQEAPAASSHVAPKSPVQVETGLHVAQAQQPPLRQTASVTPPRMPGPRYQPQRKPAAQPQQPPAPPAPTAKAETPEPPPAVAETRTEQQEEPVEKPAAPPKQEGSPDTRQPAAPPPDEQETEVASAHAPATGLTPRAPAANTGRPPGAVGATIADALDKIPPPKAVEVQPFRPNDVIRPPAARRSAPATAEPPLLSTLSSQFQSMVPKMAINAQVYSTQPQRRFVIINMKRYNEGQNTAEGVNIVSIRQDDIIFAYQGQRFRIGR